MQTQWIPRCMCLLSKEKPDGLMFINGALQVSLPTHSSLLENHWAVSDSPCSLKQLLETLSASTQIPILQKARQRQDQIKLSGLAFSTVKSGRRPFLMVSWCHHTSKNVLSLSQANQCLSFHVSHCNVPVFPGALSCSRPWSSSILCLQFQTPSPLPNCLLWLKLCYN